MHHLPRKVEVTIRSFYIFNTTYGQKEGQEKEKILYYYPKEIDINAKIRDVGLSQAFTAFTDSFSEKPGECEVIHTEKTTQLLYQPEANFWLVLVLNVPKEIHSKDGVEYPEYHKYELHDALYRRLLIQSYNRFCLEDGTFQMILDQFSDNKETARDYLTQKLENFFNKYITSLKLPANDIIEFMNSLQYLPLDKFLFLRVHNFIDSLKSTFPTITDAIFLYKEFVVVGGKLNSSNLFTLYQYIFQNIEITQRDPMSNAALNSRNIFLKTNGQLVSYKMILFPSTNALLCLFFKQTIELTSQLLDELSYAINSQLYVLSRDIEDYLAKQPNAVKASTAAVSSIDCTNNAEYMSPKYLFLNDQSLKLSSNLYDDEPQHRTPLPQNVTNLIADLFNSADNEVEKPQRDADKTSYSEIMVKSTDDFWIVKRRFNWRQRFVVIFSQKATLLDVTKEAERIFEQEIKDGVFADK
ncbi:vacuolar fusion protein CCZ1 homolog [Calliphora vicina]|uniref:vacuolar fusion protein CCZ1 homolog n=1 Tax=Calliphora vicina TaxID=7373 RepID=UPI00325B9C79